MRDGWLDSTFLFLPFEFTNFCLWATCISDSSANFILIHNRNSWFCIIIRDISHYTIHLQTDLYIAINDVQYWSLLNWHKLRLRCGCVAVRVNWFLTLFHHVLRSSRTLYIVWSLVRRRVTRRFTMLQTMCNAKYSKTLRCGCVAVAFNFSIYLKPVLYDRYKEIN